MKGDGNLWEGDYKIPWDDPGFSGRMLREHLSQEHDLASRRREWIDRQVAWIHERLLKDVPSRVLDMGCGPGFYCHRLASRGHDCRGIDFGPASIAHAAANVPEGGDCGFVSGDLRTIPFKGAFDLVMMLYGELNVFSPEEAAGILAKARRVLVPGGWCIVEAQTPEAVEGTGRSAPSEARAEAGLFSDAPHVCRTESRWVEGVKTAVQTFTITDEATGSVRLFRNTTRAISGEELAGLLRDAGFSRPVREDSWPCNGDDLMLWSARG